MSSKINKKIPKIAYLLDVFPRLSETFILNEIIELERQGLDISIFSIREPKDEIVHKKASELTEETHYPRDISRFKIFYAHLYFLFRRPVRYLKLVRFIYKTLNAKSLGILKRSAFYALLFDKLKIEHIHVHFADYASGCAIPISLLSGIPYSFTIHAHDIFKRFNLIREKIEYAEFVITISEYNKKFVKEKCPQINEDKIFIIHCGVDPRKQAIHNLERQNGSFEILSVSRLVDSKGIRYLLEACSLLAESGMRDFTCKIVGFGPLRNNLEELAGKLNISDLVQFLGPVTNDKVFSLLQKSDVCVLPCVIGKDNNMDGIPVYLMEAMTLGKPVISTYISGIPELIKNGAGILVAPKDSEALAKAIRRIYLMDYEARNDMGNKGRKIIAEEFNLEKECEKIKNLFLGSPQKVNSKSINLRRKKVNSFNPAYNFYNLSQSYTKSQSNRND